MGNCQNYGPFLGPYYNTGPNTGPNSGDPKRDHNFDKIPHIPVMFLLSSWGSLLWGSHGLRKSGSAWMISGR